MTDLPERADEDLVSVGKVSSATGISPGTLRMWERRYGVPEPVRLASGHRRYTQAQLRRLVRIAEALRSGHRPGAVVRLSEEELDELLSKESEAATAPELDAWMDAVREFDADRLNAGLRAVRDGSDPVFLLEERISPLLHRIGREWADGKMGVRHEHFASHIVEDFLRELRMSILKGDSPWSSGQAVLCTLPGEQHGLGVEMAAILFARHRIRTWVLGVDTPLDQIVTSAREARADVVGVSVSKANAGVRTDEVLKGLREQLPESTDLLVGGDDRGNRRKLKGVQHCEKLSQLDAWLRKRFPKRTNGRA